MKNPETIIEVPSRAVGTIGMQLKGIKNEDWKIAPLTWVLAEALLFNTHKAGFLFLSSLSGPGTLFLHPKGDLFNRRL